MKVNPYIMAAQAAAAATPKPSKSATDIILITGIAFLGWKFAIKPALDQAKLNSAEAKLDTEAGRIAQQFKTLFDGWGVVYDADFKKINVQVNAKNKDEVYKIYRDLTGRNLSADISNHVSADNVKAAAKIEAYNSNPVGLFKIDQNEKITFKVAKGAKVRGAVGVKAFYAYADPYGIAVFNSGNQQLIDYYKNGAGYSASKNPAEYKAAVAKATRSLWNAESVTPGYWKIWTLTDAKEVPFEGVKPREGWLKYLLPLVRTSKTFAAVQIGTAWIDARDLQIAAASVKGIGNLNLNLL
ncbi:MAG: hypothetical protein KF900_13975 [Bacteroidetes bacterium]|nr:hypothetical protein [Bacteroidota bacterium]